MRTAKVSGFKAENAILRKECEISFKVHAKTKARLAKDFIKTRDDWWKKRSEFAASRAKVGKLEKELATVRDAPKTNVKKIEGIKS